MQELYYIPPTDDVFNEVRDKAIKIRNNYDEMSWYATDQVDRIKDLINIRDNMMYIVSMFDIINRGNLLDSLSDKARQAIIDRM